MDNDKSRHIHQRYNTNKQQILNEIISFDHVMVKEKYYEFAYQMFNKKAQIQFIMENKLEAFKDERVL